MAEHMVPLCSPEVRPDACTFFPASWSVGTMNPGCTSSPVPSSPVAAGSQKLAPPRTVFPLGRRFPWISTSAQSIS